MNMFRNMRDPERIFWALAATGAVEVGWAAFLGLALNRTDAEIYFIVSCAHVGLLAYVSSIAFLKGRPESGETNA